MRVIDLLNKIANGEEVPEKIKWHDKVWIRDFEGAYYYYEENTDNLFMEAIEDTTWLNKEVEIIEEDKKIEKLNLDYILDNDISKYFGNKINEIIDVINKGD